MKISLVLIALMCQKVSPFQFITRRWNFGDTQDPIHSLSVDNGNLFLSRHCQLQWLRPTPNKPIIHTNRYLPRSINHVVVQKKAFLANMIPEDSRCVSESMVIHNDKCYNVRWHDTTMFETVIEKNGYILRSNYFGNITYGNYENLFTYNTRVYTNTTYSAMCVEHGFLWCATEYWTKNQTRATRIDAFDLHVKGVDGFEYLASMPEMSFVVDTRDAFQPHQLRVCIQNYAPKKIIVLVLGFMMGGVVVAQSFYPTEKKKTQTMCRRLETQGVVRSLSLDMPYLFILDDNNIYSYKIYPRIDLPMFLGKYCLPINYYQETTQIVSFKNHVFWNGQDILHSAEIVE